MVEHIAGIPEHVKKEVDAAYNDLASIASANMNRLGAKEFETTYVGTLSGHLVRWGMSPSLAARVSREVLNLHRNVLKKVPRFFERVYNLSRPLDAHGILYDALYPLYEHAHDPDFVQELTYDSMRRGVYLDVLNRTARAVQQNYPLTSHTVREGYSIARLLAAAPEYLTIKDLALRILSRRDNRALTDLRHILQIIHSSNHPDEYLSLSERALRRVLKSTGRSAITKRAPFRKLITALVPFAVHASFIDSPGSLPRSRAYTVAMHDVAAYLYGMGAEKKWRRLFDLARDPNYSPLLIALAKHWDSPFLNDRFHEAMYRYLRGGHQAVADYVHSDGQLAWGDLWRVLSVSTTRIVDSADGRRSFLYALGKRAPWEALASICNVPTCYYPANKQGQRYGVEYVLNTRKGDVMPIIAHVHEVNKHTGRQRTVGRITMMASPAQRQIYITSLPVGYGRVEDFIALAKEYAQRANAVAGKRIFERVIVGGLGRSRFRIPIDDGYDDFIKRSGGAHYVYNAGAVPID